MEKASLGLEQAFGGDPRYGLVVLAHNLQSWQSKSIFPKRAINEHFLIYLMFS